MEKEFDVIPIEDYAVVVDNQQPIHEGDWINRGKELTEANDEWNGETHEEWKKVIASIGKRIEGLPLIVLPDEVEEKARVYRDYFEQNLQATHNPAFTGFIEGYKAAQKEGKVYSEKDVLSFTRYMNGLQRTKKDDYFLFKHPEDDFCWFTEKELLDNYMQSFQKKAYPTKLILTFLIKKGVEVKAGSLIDMNNYELKTTPTPEGDIIHPVKYS